MYCFYLMFLTLSQLLKSRLMMECSEIQLFSKVSKDNTDIILDFYFFFLLPENSSMLNCIQAKSGVAVNHCRVVQMGR